jgi:hypothetical protein
MPIERHTYFAGLDLGQARDHSAITICEKITQRYSESERAEYASMLPPRPPSQYHVRHLERLPLGMPYPQQVRYIKTLLEQPPLTGAVTLALDFTGCGRPVFDQFRETRIRCVLVPVSIHGGAKVTREGMSCSVPKRDLVSITQVLFQAGRLKIADSLPLAPTLFNELLNFQMTIDPRTAHDSYASWREGIHDDLVLSLCLACWYGEHAGLPPYLTEVEGL